MNVDEMKDALIQAARDGNCSRIRELYAHFPELVDETIQYAPFHRRFVAWIHVLDLDAIGTLVELGVDVNRVSDAGQMALRQSIYRGSVPHVKKLLELGADPNLGCPIISVASPDDPKAQIEMATLLLDYGADINRDAGIEGYTPLCRAMDKERPELVEFLKSRGGKCPLLDNPPPPKPDLDLDTFQERLEKALRECWDGIRKEYPNETFTMFGLETDSDLVIVNAIFDSQEAIERDRENRKPLNSKFAMALQYPDNEFYGKGEPWLGPLSDELNSVITKDMTRREDARRKKRVIKIFESALRNLDQQGLFGVGEARNQIMLLISFLDPDLWEFIKMLRIIKRLNPPTVYKEFKKVFKLMRKQDRL